MTVTAIANRPYLLVFHATGTAYPVSSTEVRRLLESYPGHTWRRALFERSADDPSKPRHINVANLEKCR